MKQYCRLRLSRVPSSQESEVAALCFAHGSQGVAEALQFTQKDLVYEPEIRYVKFIDLDAYFEDLNHQSPIFAELSDQFPIVQAAIFNEDHKDWLEEWKKGFVPFSLVGPFWVVPSWLEVPSQAEIPLSIDPGMAFGTGTHATTQLAAALLHRVLKKSVPLVPEGEFLRVLDVGTGTAILAILARKAGAEYVVGLDTDPEARRVARENAIRNDVADIDIPDVELADLKEKFEIVVANIIDGVLLKLKNDLYGHLERKVDSHLIVTGILLERESLFLDSFLKGTDLRVERRVCKDEWVGYWLQAPRKI